MQNDKFRIGDHVKAPDGTVGRVVKIDDSDLPFLVENGQTAPWYYRANELASDTAGPSDPAGLVARLEHIALLHSGTPMSLVVREAIAALSRAPEAVKPDTPPDGWQSVPTPYATPPAPKPALALIERLVEVYRTTGRFSTGLEHVRPIMDEIEASAKRYKTGE